MMAQTTDLAGMLALSHHTTLCRVIMRQKALTRCYTMAGLPSLQNHELNSYSVNHPGTEQKTDWHRNCPWIPALVTPALCSFPLLPRVDVHPVCQSCCHIACFPPKGLETYLQSWSFLSFSPRD